MRYSAAEKLEIIHLVEQSHLPVRRTLDKLGIRPATPPSVSNYLTTDTYFYGCIAKIQQSSYRAKKIGHRISTLCKCSSGYKIPLPIKLA
jgi:putative transposase